MTHPTHITTHQRVAIMKALMSDALSPSMPADCEGSISSEEWCEWLRASLRASPCWALHPSLLQRCATLASAWRHRFWDRPHLWTRIRRGKRLGKEIAEVAPVIARVEAFEPSPSTPKLVILDLCSGFGYLGMLLSELLPPHKVERIVLVDVRWAPHNTTPQPHHLSAEHILDPGWPIRLSTSRSDLKSPSDRRILARSFLSHGSPAMLLGVHLCGTLSLHAVEIFNDCPCLASLCLKPCCLPPKLFARRGDVFGGASGHLFPAAAVSVDGKWNRGKWVGRSAREEVESKFHCWVDNLSKCIRAVDHTSSVSVESHVVQTGWFQNLFIFSERQWRADPPYSARHSHASGAGIGGEVEAGLLGEVGEAGKAGEVRLNVLPPPNTSNSCGLSEARKEAIIGAWREGKKEARRQRRAARWSAEQRERARRIADAREGDALCVTIDFSESCEDRVQLRCLILPQ
ncbi:MAG: hypothetical protein SGPRY_002857 [Prymnesium sp.]